LYDPKQKNFIARFGVSAQIGGRIPLYKAGKPSLRIVFRTQSAIPLNASALP
jgi:hypothetical protein